MSLPLRHRWILKSCCLLETNKSLHYLPRSCPRKQCHVLCERNLSMIKDYESSFKHKWILGGCCSLETHKLLHYLPESCPCKQCHILMIWPSFNDASKICRAPYFNGKSRQNNARSDHAIQDLKNYLIAEVDIKIYMRVIRDRCLLWLAAFQ